MLSSVFGESGAGSASIPAFGESSPGISKMAQFCDVSRLFSSSGTMTTTRRGSLGSRPPLAGSHRTARRFSWFSSHGVALGYSSSQSFRPLILSMMFSSCRCFSRVSSVPLAALSLRLGK